MGDEKKDFKEWQSDRIAADIYKEFDEYTDYDVNSLSDYRKQFDGSTSDHDDSVLIEEAGHMIVGSEEEHTKIQLAYLYEKKCEREKYLKRKQKKRSKVAQSVNS